MSAAGDEFTGKDAEDETSTETNSFSSPDNGSPGSSTADPLDGSSWRDILDTCQLTLTCFGFVANVLTLVTLVRNGKGFSRLIRLLLQHQSIIDATVCAMALILLVQPFNWTSGVYWLDVLVCQVWHSQTFYWGMVNVSVWNLVLIAFERFLAVCHPFKHQNIRSKTLYYTFVFTDFMIMVVFMGPSYFQTHFHSRLHKCLSEYYFSGDFMKTLMYIYVIVIFFFTYIIPCSLFFFLYTYIIVSLRRRQKQAELGMSRLIDQANKEFTRTSITVTLFFIIFLGFDLWYYVLGYTSVTQYVLNSPLQKIGVFFSVMNSAVNPVIYAMFMPIFRVCFMKTVLCCRVENMSNDITGSTDCPNPITSKSGSQ